MQFNWRRLTGAIIGRRGGNLEGLVATKENCGEMTAGLSKLSK